MSASVKRWIKYSIAVVAGNALYFGLSPRLPPRAQHHSYRLDLGTVVDFWFCLLVYGIIELGIFLSNRRRRSRS